MTSFTCWRGHFLYCVYIYSANVNAFISHISVKFLEFVKPFCAVLPEISKPDRKVILNYKCWMQIKTHMVLQHFKIVILKEFLIVFGQI